MADSASPLRAGSEAKSPSKSTASSKRRVARMEPPQGSRVVGEAGRVRLAVTPRKLQEAKDNKTKERRWRGTPAGGNDVAQRDTSARRSQSAERRKDYEKVRQMEGIRKRNKELSRRLNSYGHPSGGHSEAPHSPPPNTYESLMLSELTPGSKKGGKSSRASASPRAADRMFSRASSNPRDSRRMRRSASPVFDGPPAAVVRIASPQRQAASSPMLAKERWGAALTLNVEAPAPPRVTPSSDPAKRAAVLRKEEEDRLRKSEEAAAAAISASRGAAEEEGEEECTSGAQAENLIPLGHLFPGQDRSSPDLMSTLNLTRRFDDRLSEVRSPGLWSGPPGETPTSPMIVLPMQ
eukprot:TRINITY_DN65341_c0_g1_i1.p1 TRINITY_DN65341_c0_g1~~TRINITY_DN65341_c0_g1_i1.p1  ORF type:complete len:360 (+),score=82.45 TRINITY_DN65341_c0_g1_i1:29-1081(+)